MEYKKQAYVAPRAQVLMLLGGQPTLQVGSPTGEHYDDPSDYGGFGVMEMFDSTLF